MKATGIAVCIGLLALNLSCEKKPQQNEPRPADAGAARTADPQPQPRKEGPKVAAARAHLMTILRGLVVFKLHMGRFPTSEEGLDALRERPRFEEEMMARRWAGPYLRSLPRDPWGNEYHYALAEEGDGPHARAWSNGPDGMEGTADDVVLKE